MDEQPNNQLDTNQLSEDTIQQKDANQLPNDNNITEEQATELAELAELARLAKAEKYKGISYDPTKYTPPPSYPEPTSIFCTCIDGIFCCDDDCCNGRTTCGCIGQGCTCIICCPPWAIFTIVSIIPFWLTCCCCCKCGENRDMNEWSFDSIRVYCCLMRLCCPCFIPKQRIKDIEEYIDKKK